MVTSQTRIRTENETSKILWDFEIQSDPSFLAGASVKEQEKRIWYLVDFAVPADPRVKTRNKYLDLTRERKKYWNLKVTVIPIIIGALKTDMKRKKTGGTEN